MTTVDELIKKAKIIEETKKGMKRERIKQIKSKIKSGVKKIHGRIEKVESKTGKFIDRVMNAKLKSRKILKPSKTTLTIKKFTPAPYVNRYFKDEMKEAKEMFFE